jgi:hypothetical protein
MEIYIKSKDGSVTKELYSSQGEPVYMQAMNDVVLTFSAGALGVKEVGDSSYYLPLEMSLSEPLRRDMEQIKKSHPYNKYKKVRGR